MRKRKYVKHPNMSIYAAQRRGNKAAHWKGGIVYIAGRKWVYAPGHPNAVHSNRYVVESRYVMSEKLGRPLKSTELVHHIDGDVNNNRVENLVVTTRKIHNQIHKLEGTYAKA